MLCYFIIQYQQPEKLETTLREVKEYFIDLKPEVATRGKYTLSCNQPSSDV
jgi:hypothetical protein